VAHVGGWQAFFLIEITLDGFLDAIKGLTNSGQVGNQGYRPEQIPRSDRWAGLCLLHRRPLIYRYLYLKDERLKSTTLVGRRKSQPSTIEDRPTKTLNATTSRCPIARFNDNETKSKAFLSSNNSSHHTKNL